MGLSNPPVDRAALNAVQRVQQSAGATTALLSADKLSLLDPAGGAGISIRPQAHYRYDAPYLLAPSGSFVDVSGAFTLSTALTVVPNGLTPGGGNCWVYFPAGAGGLAVGWREAFFATTTAGYLIGLPTTTATAWTGASGIIALPPLTIAGNALGPNGRADALIISRNNNSAGTKSMRAGAGGPTTGLFVTQNTVASGARVSPVLVNRGATNRQVPGVDSGFVGVGTVPPYFAIDTSAPWAITPSLQCAVATDWVMIDYAAVTCTYIG